MRRIKKLNEETNARCDNDIMVTQNMTLGDKANEMSRCLQLVFKRYNKNYIYDII